MLLHFFHVFNVNYDSMEGHELRERLVDIKAADKREHDFIEVHTTYYHICNVRKSLTDTHRNSSTRSIV